MSSIFQKSFTSGEVTTAIYARCDLAKYASGLRTLRNMFVARHGGAYNRPGSVFCSPVSDSTHRVRLVPFILPGGVNYQLEFGHLYVRILRDGAPVLTSVKDIQFISKAANAVVTTKEPHSNLVGDQVVFANIVGMTQMNGLTGTITAVGGANLFTVNIDSTGFTTYTSGGTATPTSPHEIKYTTIYTESVLREFTFSQEDKTLTVAHQSGLPLLMSYVTAEYWARIQNTDLVVPKIGKPTWLSGPISAWTFFVTGANATAGATYTIAGRTFTVVTTIGPGNSLVCTSTDAPPTSGTLTKTGGTGDATIAFSAVANNFGQGFYFGITAIDQNTFEEGPIATWGVVSGTTAPYNLAWSPVSGAIQYNIYFGVSAQSLGFLDTTGDTTYSDDGVTLKADKSSPPPIERIIFANSGGNAGPGSMLPAAVGTFQQRRFFGNTGPANLSDIQPPPTLPLYPNYADRIYGSRIGSPTYFNQQRPTPADGQLSFRLLHKKPQTIRHFLDLGKLAIFTEEGEWILDGDPSSGGITPGSINPRNVSLNGSGFTPPLAIGSDALYIQYNKKLNSSIVRTLGFQIQIDSYRGDDVTIYSSHLTDGFQLVAWDLQKLPHPIIWMAREDGILLGLTFLPEQSVVAWHRHDFTNGLVEDVMTSGEQVYLVIKRTINGSTVRYIERLASRSFATISDAIFVDSCKTFDGRNTDTAKTMTLSGGSLWDENETLTLTSSAAFFSGASVGRFVHLRGPNDELVRLKITNQSSTTVVSGTVDKTVPPVMRNLAISKWADATFVITGLSHLEGQKVSVLGDGFVISSPNNSDYPTLTVSGGQIVLSDGEIGYAVVQVGLPITADLETLNIDNPQGPTMMDKAKLVTKVSLWMESSRGAFVGTSRPDVDNYDPLAGLEQRFDELKYRRSEGYDDPNKLITRAEEINVEGTWDKNGRVFVRQVDPLPLGILAIAPAGFLPFGVP